MFAGASLAEEGVEGIISATNGLVRGHLAIRLDAVLQAVQLPAGVAHLDSGLADMDADAFTLKHKMTNKCYTVIVVVKYSRCLYNNLRLCYNENQYQIAVAVIRKVSAL